MIMGPRPGLFNGHGNEMSVMDIRDRSLVYAFLCTIYTHIHFDYSCHISWFFKGNICIPGQNFPIANKLFYPNLQQMEETF